MKALVLEGIQQLAVRSVPDPEPAPLGAFIRVQANGVCRSDWHGWIGDSKRDFPTIMGHEMTGIIEDVMPGVTRFKKGDRVVVPFSGSEGTCEYCQSGQSHLCDGGIIPGRTYPGGYAEYVSVPHADRNLMVLPEDISFTDGAALGCRFMTSFHGLVDRAELRAGEWVVVYGCGGVGLSAINIAASLGATVIGVDINDANLDLAKRMGAHFTINSRELKAVEAVMQMTRGGAHVAVDALGIAQTCVDAIMSLRKGGRQLQIGLTTKKEAGYISVPIDTIVLRELKIIGSLGMAPHRFASMIPMVASGRLTPGMMVTKEITLSDVGEVFDSMTRSANTGTFIVTRFE
ncbi:alcohol dehydrogenase catalytic domain-containing protein [Caballeronia sp. GAWG2-1]|uniref:zinc-binding dehydrogenase n=1 Tax=Caballeronia sp. GAWG2-1 TaxID=2921744 RepID=UPI002027ECBB|nr:alcohol dehydrogenase catalytic domain-containing protein [Caballeronia sp. GAWG2-1]